MPLRPARTFPPHLSSPYLTSPHLTLCVSHRPSSDRDMIMNAVQSTVGFTALNQKTTGHLRWWLAMQAQEALFNLPDVQRYSSPLALQLPPL